MYGHGILARKCFLGSRKFYRFCVQRVRLSVRRRTTTESITRRRCLCRVWGCFCFCVCVVCVDVLCNKQDKIVVLFLIYILLLIQELITFHDMIEFCGRSYLLPAFIKNSSLANGATPFETQTAKRDNIYIICTRWSSADCFLLGAMDTHNR